MVRILVPKLKKTKSPKSRSVNKPKSKMILIDTIRTCVQIDFVQFFPAQLKSGFSFCSFFGTNNLVTVEFDWSIDDLGQALLLPIVFLNATAYLVLVGNGS